MLQLPKGGRIVRRESEKKKQSRPKGERIVRRRKRRKKEQKERSEARKRYVLSIVLFISRTITPPLWYVHRRSPRVPIFSAALATRTEFRVIYSDAAPAAFSVSKLLEIKSPRRTARQAWVSLPDTQTCYDLVCRDHAQNPNRSIG